MRRRTNQVCIRLSDEELAELKEKLTLNHLSASEFLRRIITNTEVKIVPEEIMRDVQKQVRGIGRNVNQIARLAHISGNVSAETLRQLGNKHEKIEEQLDRIYQWLY